VISIARDGKLLGRFNKNSISKKVKKNDKVSAPWLSEPGMGKRREEEVVTVISERLWKPGKRGVGGKQGPRS